MPLAPRSWSPQCRAHVLGLTPGAPGAARCGNSIGSGMACQHRPLFGGVAAAFAFGLPPVRPSIGPGGPPTRDLERATALAVAGVYRRRTTLSPKSTLPSKSPLPVTTQIEPSLWIAGPGARHPDAAADAASRGAPGRRDRPFRHIDGDHPAPGRLRRFLDRAEADDHGAIDHRQRRPLFPFHAVESSAWSRPAPDRTSRLPGPAAVCLA